jgi:transcriptional regulator with XRE-family HTH domain
MRMTSQETLPVGAEKSDAPGVPIGEQIRDLRKAKGLTITELAKRINRSTGYVSQIERNISSVSISTLQKIAAVLGVQMSWFFQGNAIAPEEERDFIVRRERRRKMSFSEASVTEELLSPNLSGKLEIILTTFSAGSSTGEEDRVRKGEEAGLVISGTLELWVEDKYFLLREGDSFTFQREGPHRCHNPGDTDAIVLWVITPPSY